MDGQARKEMGSFRLLLKGLGDYIEELVLAFV
jgi:hypothetical protein